jgi:cyclase
MTISATVRAQPDPYRVERLAAGVFAVVRKVPTTGASDSNVLFIINDDDVVVVDANIYPTSAKQVITEIRRRTRNPVRYVINTHYHSDHHYGNGEYKKAFPGVQFISHPVTRSLILTEDIPALRKNVTTDYPETISRIEKALATGKRSNGTAIDEGERKELTDDLAMYRFFLRDVRTMQQVPATITVADSLVLHRGARRIEVKWIGRGNTAGDLVVHLPVERVLATGDLVVSPIPFGFESFLPDWSVTLRRLKTLDASRIMPGHGEIMSDWSYSDRLATMLDSVWAQASRAVASGGDLDATRKAVKLAPFRDQFAGDDARARRAFDALFATPIVEGVFKQLRAAAPR